MKSSNKSLSLQPVAVAMVERGADGIWHATGQHPCVELCHGDGPIPSGWVLLRGMIKLRSHCYAAFLHVELDRQKDKRASFELYVSKKGTIIDLIPLPPGSSRLLLEPMEGLGSFALENFSIKPTGCLECLWRMIRRVAPLYTKLNRIRRTRAGLRIGTAIFNLREAYRIAGRFRAFIPLISFEHWLDNCDRLKPSDLAAIRADQPRLRDQYRFLILIGHQGREQDRDATRQSLADQFYHRHEQVANMGAFAALVATLSPQERQTTWGIFLCAGTRLAPQALYWFASQARSERLVRLLYTDHDIMDANGKRSWHVFKPDWSPEHLRATNYIGQAVAFRADLLAELDLSHIVGTSPTEIHDLLLRSGEKLAPAEIGHIYALLFHQKDDRGAAPPPPNSDNPVARHLRRLGIKAAVEGLPNGHYRVRYALPESPPLVSIIVATRDQYLILRRCLESLFSKTSYPHYEVLVVDNQSRDPETLDYLRQLAVRPRVSVLGYDHPFNYSAISNFAVGRAAGDILCLLNNDTEVINRNWLEEMVSHLLQPGVGVVGAKLYFPNGRVQHAGDVVGPGGCANHLHAGLAGDAPGYCDRAILAQELSAVTAACFVTPRDLYNALGGFDEKHLGISFNDVDYCLRVGERGLRVIWTPYAELYHHESLSRRGNDTPEKRKKAKREVRYMCSRWRQVMFHDPYYNPNLSYAHPDFSLNLMPHVKKPWKR